VEVGSGTGASLNSGAELDEAGASDVGSGAAELDSTLVGSGAATVVSTLVGTATSVEVAEGAEGVWVKVLVLV
jgi:hypothetical protein